MQPLRGTVFLVDKEAHGDDAIQPFRHAELDFFFELEVEAPRLVARIETDAQGRYELDLSVLRPLLGSVAELSSTWMWLWPRSPDKRIGGANLSLTEWLHSPREEVDYVIGELDHFILEGRVIDSVGLPVEAALVGLKWAERDFQTYTDAGGRFSLSTTIPLNLASKELEASEAVATIQIHSSSRVEAEEALDLRQWDSHVVELGEFAFATPETLALVSGRAEAVDGRPLPNWPIRWELSEWTVGTDAEWTVGTDAEWTNSKTIFTNSEGSFAFDGFEEPGTLSLESGGQRAEVWTRMNGPQSGIVLQLQRPSAEIVCKDPEGHICSPPTRWEFFEQGGFVSVTEHDEFPRSAFGSNFEGDRMYLLLPRGGTYRARATWPGYRGTWRVDQEFEVLPQHQRIELRAKYESHPPTPVGD